MCRQPYFTDEDVKQTINTLQAEHQEGVKTYAGLSDLIKDEAKAAAFAGLIQSVSGKDPFKTLGGIFAAGVEFGVTLAGGRDRIPPPSEETAAQVEKYINEQEAASIPQEVLQSAAAA